MSNNFQQNLSLETYSLKLNVISEVILLIYFKLLKINA